MPPVVEVPIISPLPIPTAVEPQPIEPVLPQTQPAILIDREESPNELYKAIGIFFGIFGFIVLVYVSYVVYQRIRLMIKTQEQKKLEETE